MVRRVQRVRKGCLVSLVRLVALAALVRLAWQGRWVQPDRRGFKVRPVYLVRWE